MYVFVWCEVLLWVNLIWFMECVGLMLWFLVFDDVVKYVIMVSFFVCN